MKVEVILADELQVIALVLMVLYIIDILVKWFVLIFLRKKSQDHQLKSGDIKNMDYMQIKSIMVEIVGRERASEIITEWRKDLEYSKQKKPVDFLRMKFYDFIS